MSNAISNTRLDTLSLRLANAANRMRQVATKDQEEHGWAGRAGNAKGGHEGARHIPNEPNQAVAAAAHSPVPRPHSQARTQQAPHRTPQTQIHRSPKRTSTVPSRKPPFKARRLHNLTLQSLRIAMVTSLADDDPLELCYATLGFYTRRMLLPPRDVFVLDASRDLGDMFNPCYAAYNVSVLRKALTSDSDYAVKMDSSDARKRRWYGELQSDLFKQVGNGSRQ